MRLAEQMNVEARDTWLTTTPGRFSSALGRLNTAALAVALALTGNYAANANQFVQLDYNLTLSGRSRDTVFFELFNDKPLTSANFMQYVNGGKWDGMFMNRLSHGFVMQGGGFYPEYQAEPSIPSVPWSLKSSADVRVDLDGNPATANPTVVNEYAVGSTRSNVRGTIAMARQGGLPNSASNEWFVNYNNNSGLDSVDGGFTVFGEVRGDGMAYYDALDVLATQTNPPNGMVIVNLNQDSNNDGVREGGPFGLGTNDAVPVLFGLLDNLVVVQKAKQIDYYGNTGSSTSLNFPAAGYTIATRDAFFDTGTLFTGNGGLTIGAGRTLGIREGVTLGRSVNNLGTLAPGLQNAAIIVPSYIQGASGTLAVDIRGTTVDTHYDRLSVTGSSTLAGKLKVSLLNLFQPKSGNAFTVLTAGSITNDFSSYEFPALDPGMFWSVDKTATSITLVAVGGDYDHNGTVNTADYTLWKNTFGTTVTVFNGADGNGNGKVDAADYTIWRDSLGRVAFSPGAGSGVATNPLSAPEPGTALLMAIAAGALAVRRRQRIFC